MLERLQRLVAAERGYAELRLHRNLTRRVAMRRGALIQNVSSTLAGVSARCHAFGTFGFASLPAEDDAALEKVLAEARANADLIGRRAGHTDRPLPRPAPGDDRHDYRTAKPKVGAAPRIDLLNRLNDYVKTRYPDVTNADLVIGEIGIEKALATSEGARSYCYSPRAVLWIELSVEGPDGPVQLFDVLGGFGEIEDQMEAFAAAEAAVDRLYEDLRRKAEGVFCEAGTHDVVLDSDVAGILAHEAIGHTCEADIVLTGSIAADRIGHKVASEKITLMDQAGRGFDGKA